jgi:hypothetical protein
MQGHISKIGFALQESDSPLFIGDSEIKGE